MTLIPYKSVEQYHEDYKTDIASTLTMLENSIIDGRDNRGLPIYLTKQRVKSISSIYLKTRRKLKTTLDKITDYGGLRVLCLFEQDIPQLHQYIIDLFKRKTFSLKEFKIFNWGQQQVNFVKQLKAVVDGKFDGYEFDCVPDPESGYKSIHYVVTRRAGDNFIPIEVQLRTLLQDAWGELEHALSYKKGNVHPYIKKNFYLLSRDLQNMDELIRHLRDTSDRQKAIESFSIESGGPHKAFVYEERLAPAVFRSDGPLKNAVNSYNAHIVSERLKGKITEWVRKGQQLYKTVERAIPDEEKSDPKIHYWLNMEKAFLLFAGGENGKALSVYDQVFPEWEGYYGAHFRKGEIYFIRGQIEDALVAFDESERLVGEDDHPVNAYLIKVKIASIYWLLGREYCRLALQKILEAEAIFEKYKHLFSPENEKRLINNLCWYQLEKYLVTQADQDYETTLERYKRLKSVLSGDDDEEVSADLFDTAAWFTYQSYLKTKEAEWLVEARRYCELARGRGIWMTYEITAQNVHREHMEEIMSTK